MILYTVTCIAGITMADLLITNLTAISINLRCIIEVHKYYNRNTHITLYYRHGLSIN